MNTIKRTILNSLAKSGLNFFGSKKSIASIDKPKRKKLLILGTGPSLEKLNKGVFDVVDTLSVNGYSKLIANEGWPSPTYFMVQDLEVSYKISEYIESVQSKVISSSYIYVKNKDIRGKVNYIFNHYFLDHVFCDSYLPYTYEKTMDASKYITDGYTVVYSAIELAEYLGYEEVYLLGVDASYDKNINDRNYVNINKVDNTYDTAGERIIFGIKNYSESSSVMKLYNCSEIGKLDFLDFATEIDGVKVCL